MKPQRSLITFGLAIALLSIVGLILWSANTHSSVSEPATGHNIAAVEDAKNAPLILVQPPNTCNYCSHNLVGKTAAEVAQFAQDLARQQLKAKGTPQVLLTPRAVDDQALADLGLGCGTASTAIEQPPLIVTILKGEFDFGGAAPGFWQLPPPVPGKPRYVVYVFDAWAGSPTVILASQDGAVVKKALHDPTLPDAPAGLMPSVCATPLPLAKRRMHYGEASPGSTVPPHPTYEPPYTPAPPTTPFVPTPAPTANGIPITPLPGP